MLGEPELTILTTDSRKDNVALLVYLDILHTILPPLTQQDCDLLAGSALGNRKANMARGGFDAEQPC